MTKAELTGTAVTRGRTWESSSWTLCSLSLDVPRPFNRRTTSASSVAIAAAARVSSARETNLLTNQLTARLRGRRQEGPPAVTHSGL